MTELVPPPPWSDGFARTVDSKHGGPVLVVVVDTEEEFPWDHPFSRSHTSVRAMRKLERFQNLADSFGVRPAYVIDYPIATQPDGFEPLRAWAAQNRCVIGAHVHPWVNPPFDEEVNNQNSYLCNLPPLLQRAKIGALTAAIETHLEVLPTIFKAGRYGLGSSTLDILIQAGFEVDVSVNPTMDFRGDGGPDFRAFTCRPWFTDTRAQLLEIPCTHDYIGVARHWGEPLRRVAASAPLEALRVPGVLARLGIVNRVMLSPEGNSLPEMIALTRALLADGLRVFSLTLHSPSVEPGHTPYVRTEADLETFFAALTGFFEFFFGELRGQASTPDAYRRDVLASHSATH